MTEISTVSGLRGVREALQKWQRKYFSAGISHEMWPKAVEHAFEAGWTAALSLPPSPQPALNQRMWDLVRYMRSELHTAELITDEEYAELAQDHAAVQRLEDYDKLRRAPAGAQGQVQGVQACKEVWLDPELQSEKEAPPADVSSQAGQAVTRMEDGGAMGSHYVAAPSAGSGHGEGASLPGMRHDVRCRCERCKEAKVNGWAALLPPASKPPAEWQAGDEVWVRGEISEAIEDGDKDWVEAIFDSATGHIFVSMRPKDVLRRASLERESK